MIAFRDTVDMRTATRLRVFVTAHNPTSPGGRLVSHDLSKSTFLVATDQNIAIDLQPISPDRCLLEIQVWSEDEPAPG